MRYVIIFLCLPMSLSDLCFLLFFPTKGSLGVSSTTVVSGRLILPLSLVTSPPPPTQHNLCRSLSHCYILSPSVGLWISAFWGFYSLTIVWLLYDSSELALVHTALFSRIINIWRRRIELELPRPGNTVEFSITQKLHMGHTHARLSFCQFPKLLTPTTYWMHTS